MVDAIDISTWEHVLMPWDDPSIIYVENKNISRWELILKKLKTSKITNVEELIQVIKSYNLVKKEENFEKPDWKCVTLRKYFSQLHPHEKTRFFEENGVLCTIKNLALEMKELVPKLKILKAGSKGRIKLHQLQVASILSSAFFCLFPKRQADCPSVNFITLFDATSVPPPQFFVEKLKCLLHYFKKIHRKYVHSEPFGNITYHRLYVPDHKFPRWDKTTSKLCNLRVDGHAKIEDQNRHLQVDFANKYIGGGVLGGGCVQEEIRFLISPELIAARLFTECLGNNESLLVVGAERYSQYSGYAKTFAFAGDFNDRSPMDVNNHRGTWLIMLDALNFSNPSLQYRESKILREIKKAYVGFKPEGVEIVPVATGNWGCGIYRGDPQLKALIQIMACSESGRDMLYLTFGNQEFQDKLLELYSALKEKDICVGTLYCLIKSFIRNGENGQTLFEFILNELKKLGSKKTPVLEMPLEKEGSEIMEISSKATVLCAKTREPEIKTTTEICVNSGILAENVKEQSGGAVEPSKLDCCSPHFNGYCCLTEQNKEKPHRSCVTPESEDVEIHCSYLKNMITKYLSNTTTKRTETPKILSNIFEAVNSDDNKSESNTREQQNLTSTRQDLKRCYSCSFLNVSNEDENPPSVLSLSNKEDNKATQESTNRLQVKKIRQAKITDCFFKK